MMNIICKMVKAYDEYQESKKNFDAQLKSLARSMDRNESYINENNELVVPHYEDLRA